jgi:hypothetical protein
MRKRRVTGLYMLRRLTAARATFLLGQSLPSVARSHAKTPPHCQPPGWRLATSYTAGTLDNILAKVYKKVYNNLFHNFFKKYLTNTKIYRIMYRMKVTAMIVDDFVNNVKAYTRSSTVTEAITIALKDWVDIYNIKELNMKISQNPIHIDNGQQIREMNRSI